MYNVTAVQQKAGWRAHVSESSSSHCDARRCIGKRSCAAWWPQGPSCCCLLWEADQNTAGNCCRSTDQTAPGLLTSTLC